MNKNLIARTLIKRGREIVSHINEYSDGSYWVSFGTPSQMVVLSWRCQDYDKAISLATKCLTNTTPITKRIEF